MTSEMNDIASKSLGDSTSYAIYTDTYDKSLLNPMPRSIARNENNITGEEFDGYDVWHCYEATFLTNLGHPISGILKFVYPSSTEYMVESKSMKLFLNSFDMCKMGNSVESAISNYISVVKSSLIEVLNDDRVEVNFFKHSDILKNNNLISNKLLSNANMFEPNVNININDIYTSDFKIKREFVQSPFTLTLYESLRSRCRHTKQKDTGVASVYIAGPNVLSKNTVYQYITAMRETNEFHEFCAEKLYVNINRGGDFSSVIVGLFYTRRGSLDINPIRYNKNLNDHAKWYIEDFIDVNKLTTPSIIQ